MIEHLARVLSALKHVLLYIGNRKRKSLFVVCLLIYLYGKVRMQSI
jgi:hypothetical protein